MAWDRFGRRPKEDPVHGYVWGGGGGPHGSYMTNRDITGSEFTGFDMYDQPMKIGRRGPIDALARGYVDPEIDFRDMDPGMTPGGGQGGMSEWLKRESKILEEEEENLAEGGIASLENRPGYAFAGVVDQNASPWITRKSDKDWITQRPDVNEWITRKSDKDWITQSPDVNELLEDEENQWIQRRAGGGIASTRPGYAWGGGAKQGSSVTPITGIPWSDKPGLQHKEWKSWNKGLFDKPRHERFERGYLPDRGWYETYQSPFGTQTGMTVEPEWYEQRGHRGFNEGESYAMMQPGAKSSRTPTLAPVSKLYEDEWEAGTFPEAWRPKGLLEDWSDYPFKNDKRRFSNWQEGGAVGLEPGIGSLMGYAKGGMVTKVKVPKGQSKWMKKFINNMRDS